jgi:hypothetical protein
MTTNMASGILWSAEILQHFYATQEPNGRESAINKVLDGCTYTGQKLVPYSLCKNIIVYKKHNNLYFGLGMPSSE